MHNSPMERLLTLFGFGLLILMIAVMLAFTAYIGWLAFTAPDLTSGLVMAMPGLQLAAVTALVVFCVRDLAREALD